MNKVVVITGGSDGIGKAIAARLAHNNTVVIVAIHAEKTKKVAAELGCDYEVADVTKWGQVEQAIKNIVAKHKKIDVLMNNAGIWIEGPLDENDPEHIKKTIDVDLTGVILVDRAVVPIMKKQKSGWIIHTNSQAGLYAKPDRSVYHAAKWGVTGLSKSLQQELQPFGIKVTSIYPGYVDTQMFEKVGNPKDPKKAIQPTDIAKIVEFLISFDNELFVPEIGMKSVDY